MRKLLAVALAVILFQSASIARADNFFSINVGGPPIVISQPPDFLYPPELGFGVAVGVPYDLFYLSGIYYVYRGGGWYSTPSYGGNWVKLRSRELPPELRRYNIRKIHSYRDREYRSYSQDRTHYRGKYFRPGGERREEHHEMKAPGHEGRPEMREQHPGEHGEGRGGERREQGHER
jgi:hypothetical protein